MRLDVLAKLKVMAPAVKARKGSIRMKTWAWQEVKKRRDFDPLIRWNPETKELSYDDVPLMVIAPVSR